MIGGIRVLDLSRVVAGPYCSMLLAYMGAEVIKVEPVHGEESRALGPPFVEGESTIFLNCNRNKRGVALDFTKDEGKLILERLIKESDVLVHNFRQSFLDEIKLNFGDVIKINPEIVYCAVTGYGSKDPYNYKPAVDSVIQAASAFMFSAGEEGDPPIRSTALVFDIPAGLTAALSVVGALYERMKVGGPKFVEVSLFDMALNIQINRWGEFIAEGKNPPREINPRVAAPARHFRSSDGVYFSVSTLSDKFFRRLCEAFDRPDLAADPKYQKQERRVQNRFELLSIFTEIFAGLDSGEIAKRLQDADVIWSRVSDYEEVYNDMVLRGRFQEVTHPKTGRWIFPPVPFKTCGKTVGHRPAPVLGEHTREVLQEIGCDENYINELIQKKIVYAAEYKSEALAGNSMESEED